MKKILIVEDDLIDQMALVRMLKKQHLDYQYSVAKSIQEAKSKLKEKDFDLVISDHNLADGTTLDLLDDLKNIPFILITGNEDQPTINTVESKLGTLACFTKDLDSDYLQKLPVVIQQFFNQKINEPNQLKSYLEKATINSNLGHENISINLKNAFKIFDGKKQEVKETIELFIFHKPREMEDLYNHLNNQDCQSVIKTTHLMKSGFRLFGMKSQIDLADYIEKNVGSTEKGCTCNQVYDSFKQLSTDIKIVIELLKKELPLL